MCRFRAARCQSLSNDRRCRQLVPPSAIPSPLGEADLLQPLCVGVVHSVVSDIIGNVELETQEYNW